MRKSIALILVTLVSLTALYAEGQKEAAESGPVSLEALTIGPGPVPVTRADNLKAAAAELEGVNAEVTFSTQKFDVYRRNFSLAYRSNEAPDILSEDQDILPEYADAGMLLPLNDYVQGSDWQSEYEDFFPGLWDAVSWKGDIYGIPIEAVVGSIYYRKDVLRELGMSGREIADLFAPDSDEFTMERLLELAREAKKRGLVEYGFTHRPSAGSYFIRTVMMFGGEIVDQESGNIVIDRDALRRDFEFHRMLVSEGLMPSDMTSWEWRVVHKYTVEGRALFWIGGHTGQWKEYQEKAYHAELGQLSEDYLQENVGIAPYPSVDGPITPVTVHSYSIVSNTENPDAAFDLITGAVTPARLADHAVTTFRGPTRASVAEQPAFDDQPYLQRVLELMEFSRPFPKHPRLGVYSDMLYQAISGIETGRLGVEEAVEFMVAKGRADIPEVIIE